MLGTSERAKPMLVKVGRPIPARSRGAVLLQDRDWSDSRTQGEPVRWNVVNDSDSALPAGTRGYAIMVQGDWRVIRL